MIKLTSKSWVDLREIDSEDTLEKVKKKFVEAGFNLSYGLTRYENIEVWETLIVGSDSTTIGFGWNHNHKREDQVCVKELLREPFGKQLFGHKMRVTPESSELVQKAVFEAGGSWMSGNRKVYENIKYICINSSGSMSHLGGIDRQFNEHNFPEIKLEVVKSLKIVSKEDLAIKNKEKELQEIIDNLKEQLDNAQQQLDTIKGE